MPIYLCRIKQKASKMHTFILEWNPAISNYTERNFREAVGFLEFGDFSWSVHDHGKARSGDNFYLIRCGDGLTGVVMKGFFISDPYRGEDWAGQNREVWYMNLRPTFIVRTDHPRGILTTAALEEEMPDFRWNGGHSGRALPEAYRPVLDRMWAEYESRFTGKDFQGRRAARSDRPEAGLDDAVSLAARALFGKRRGGSPVILAAIRAGLCGRDEEEMACGFLKYVLKYSDWTAGEIRELGFSERIIDSIVSGNG